MLTVKLNNMKDISFIIICIWFCAAMYFAKLYFKERDELTMLLVEYENSLIEQKETQERLKNYVLISIELNNTCEKFKSSREEKAKNKELQELLNKIN